MEQHDNERRVASRGPIGRRGGWALAGAILLVCAAAWWWWRSAEVSEVSRRLRTEPADPVPLVDARALAGLHDANLTPRDDLRIVAAALRNYLESMRGPDAPPLGFNEEIVRALAGANPLGVAFIPYPHAAIDGAGRLCDRWGTPYHFHPLAAEVFEIRSAGEDRRLFTADDVVEGPSAE